MLNLIPLMKNLSLKGNKLTLKHKKQHILVILLLLSMQILKSQHTIDLDTPVTIKAENISIGDFIKYLQVNFGIQTGYFNEIKSFDEKISIYIQNQPLKTILDSVLHPHHIQYLFLTDKLILKENKPEKKKRILTGIVCDQRTKNVLPYCAVQLNRTFRGCISDRSGRFYIELDKAELNDSVIFSMLGYEPDTVSVEHVLKWSDYKIYLKPTTYEIDHVEINSKSGAFTRMGNKGFLTSGSIYMDTHGQQTALFIGNEHNKVGRTVKVSYYLSKKGNTMAPFRVRIYSRDTLNNLPGEDLLKEMVVVTPGENEQGWFDVNISRFNVIFPEEGLFIAMEGVYPDDYENVYTGYEFITSNVSGINTTEINDLDLVSFGQRLGYNRKGENCTWHYSITGEWFQVNKKNFNAMIAAEIKFNEDETD